MNNPDNRYLYNFLTDGEKNLLKRMYGEGVPSETEKMAKLQMENTLLNRQKNFEKNELKLDELKKEIENLKKNLFLEKKNDT